MKNYIIILCILFIGCEKETNKAQTNQNQLMKKNTIKDAIFLNIEV